MSRDERIVSIVAMEVGSRWPLWLNDVRVGSPHLVTIVQHSDQPLGALVSRVLEAANGATARGSAVDILAIACNDRTDRGAIVARAQMVKAIFGCMEQSGSGRVIFTADQRVGQDARNLLVSLARSLADGAPTTGVTVGVSFGEYRSGLWPAITAEDAPAEEAPPGETTEFRLKSAAPVASAEGGD